MKKVMKCSICASTEYSVCYKSFHPLSITSDLRIWPKEVVIYQCLNCGHLFKDFSFIKNETDKIYKSYQLFEDFDQKDQAIFLPGFLPTSRSELIVSIIESLARIPQGGDFLDIGCNRGLLLRAFIDRYPNWHVWGYDISDHYISSLKKIPKFSGFYSKKLSEINKKFNFITLIHTLEHIQNPGNFLKKIKKIMKPGSFMLIQVPDCGSNQFDMLIYEHLSHFFSETLEELIIKEGFKVVAKTNQLIPKELTFIITYGNDKYKGEINFNNAIKNKSKENKIFLYNYEQYISQISQKRKLIIFGTAEVGTWVAGLLDHNFRCFIDESPWKIGKKHLGIDIKHPDILKKGDNVILAMAPIIADQVYKKWKHTKANFLYPDKSLYYSSSS